MSLKARAKSFSERRLSYRSRLFARRLFVNTVGGAVRLAARLYDAGARAVDLAAAHGLDIHRAWDVRPRTAKPEAPAAPPFGARDFLSVMDALDARRGEAGTSARQALTPERQAHAAVGQTTPARGGRALRASVIIHVSDQVESTFRCLRSLLAEVDPGETEIVVVDDASTDETARVLSHFGGAVRVVDYCSGASLLVRRELFERIGGFDRRFAPASYADADLCFGVRSLGFKVVYQPLSRLTRYGGADGGAADGLARREAVGRADFCEKWRGVLAREHLPPGAGDAEPAANRKWGAQIAVFDELIPTPDRDAGSARMMFILRALSEWSHPVFITTGKSLRPEYEKLLWREGIETAGAPDFKRLLRRRKFRAVVLSRPAVAGALLAPVRRANPELRIVYDMLDVHHIRAAREAALTGDARAAREAETLRRLETRLARAADLVWCGSPPDQKVMARVAPGVPSVVVPTVHELHGRGLPFAGREHLLFVGNFRHRPNTDAVHFLAREVLPLIRQSLAGIELLVVGVDAPPEFAAYASAGVRLLGYVPDLDPLMAGCRVFVAPIRFGSGVNGKIGEALSYGLPVVTTAVGAEGWGFADGEQVLIADAPGDFAAAVVRLYGDAALWQRLSDGGHRHIAEHNTPEVVGRVINDSLRGGAPRDESPHPDATDS
ncbi:MAG: glycosyltransferase [Acidobacteria bacterium]|nr:glycosyltransferase [Acidobacteriota bacterium]